MAGFQVKFKDKQVRRWLRAMPKRMRRAANRGLNQGAGQVRVAGGREIRAVRPLKVAVVNKALFVRKSSPNRLRAIIVASGRVIPLTAYRMKVQTGRGRRRKGQAAARAPVTVEVTRGRRTTVRGGFTNAARNAVYRRVGPNSLPVRGLAGPSIPGTFRTRRVLRAMTRRARQQVPGLIERQIIRELAR